MELEKKDRLEWKNEYADETSLTVHKKRYLFLLELIMTFVNPKYYISYDHGRSIPEFINYANSPVFSSLEYDKSFLNNSHKITKEYKKKMAMSYMNNIGQNNSELDRNSFIFIWLGPVLLIPRLLVSFFQNLPWFPWFANFCFAIGFWMIVYSIILSFHFHGHTTPGIILFFFFRGSAITENLNLEMKIINNPQKYSITAEDENICLYNSSTQILKKVMHDEICKNSGYQLFKTKIPETEKYFSILIDLEYIYVRRGKVLFDAPFSGASFAEMLKDEDFLFEDFKAKIPDKAFIELFGKPFVQLEQRGIIAKKYDACKKEIIKAGAPVKEH